MTNQVGAAIDLNGYSGICRYNYAYFDNVQEEQTNTQLWMEFNGEINNQNFHVEFAYGKTDVPQYATSPAYPPNNPNSTYVPNISPLQKLYTQKPVLKPFSKQLWVVMEQIPLHIYREQG